MKPFDRYWRVHTTLPTRDLQPCRIIARGRLNSALVEFQDGYKCVTSRWNLRKLTTPEDPAKQ